MVTILAIFGGFFCVFLIIVICMAIFEPKSFKKGDKIRRIGADEFDENEIKLTILEVGKFNYLIEERGDRIYGGSKEYEQDIKKMNEQYYKLDK